MTNQSRRRFIKDGGKAALAGTALLALPGSEERDMKDLFIHHVYFWLKDEKSEKDLAKLIEGLRKLSAVTTIHRYQIGKPAGTNREVIDSTYSVSWLLVFKNREDQDSYQVDPVHLDFVRQCSHLWKKVVVYDSIGA